MRRPARWLQCFVIPSEVEESLIVCFVLSEEIQRFDSPLPVRSVFGLPVYVTASLAAPFSSSLEMTIFDQTVSSLKWRFPFSAFAYSSLLRIFSSSCMSVRRKFWNHASMRCRSFSTSSVM